MCFWAASNGGRSSALIRLHGVGNSAFVSEWNCLTGERYGVSATTTTGGGTVEFLTSFPVSGERVFTLSAQKEQLPQRETWVETGRDACAGPFKYSLSEPNVCILDMARFQINEGQWQEETEVLKVDQAVRRAFDLPLRSGETVQPWYRNQTQPLAETRGKVRLRFEFWIEQLPQSPVQLCVERPELAHIQLNGEMLDSTSHGWWVDNAFERLNVPFGLLVEGANVVQWEVDFQESANIEALYLLGDFGVTLSGTRKTLIALPPTLEVGDIVSQGLPFYGGALTYQIPVSEKFASGERVFLELSEWEAACAKVSAPGGEEQLIAWQPYRAEVTPILQSGVPVDLDLELILTRRNTFGPLHQTTLRASSYGPGNFLTEGDDFSRQYVLYPTGLLGAPHLCGGAKSLL